MLSGILLISACTRTKNRNILAIPIKDLSTIDGPAAFRNICKKAEIPCGLETWEPSRTGLPKLISFREETVESALTKLTDGSLRGYSWRVNDGVLEMAPEQVFKTAGGDFLTKTLAKVDIDDNVEDAIIKILEQATLVGPYGGGRALPGGGPMTYSRVSMHLKNVTTRDALNAVVKRDGKSLWQFVRASYGNDIMVYSWRER